MYKKNKEIANREREDYERKYGKIDQKKKKKIIRKRRRQESEDEEEE